MPTVPLAKLPEIVVRRLEHAGRTVLALPMAGYTTGCKTSSLEFVRAAIESYGWEKATIRPATPSGRDITAMDEAYCWLPFIPTDADLARCHPILGRPADDSVMVRRIVGARSLVHPVTQRLLYSWRCLAALLGVDDHKVKRLHQIGISEIVAELLRRELNISP